MGKVRANYIADGGNANSLTGIETCSVTVSLGIQPSQIVISLQDDVFAALGPIGTLSLTDGTTTVSFPDTRLVEYGPQFGGASKGYRAVFEDARWKWRLLPPVSVVYNRRLSDGTIDAQTQRSARDIANDLVTIQNSALPEDEYPFFEWDAVDRMSALQEICDLYGCAIAWRPTSGVHIVTLGVGTDPDPDYQTSKSRGIRARPIPQKISVVCGKTEIQGVFELEAVGVDVDGTVKLIDDLSYAPSGGWDSQSDCIHFGFIEHPDKRKLAQDTVYRWYRVKRTMPAEFSAVFNSSDYLLPPSGSASHRLVDYLPFVPKLVYSDETTSGKNKGFLVWGEYQTKRTDENTTASGNDVLWDWPLVEREADLDCENGIVKFNAPVVKRSSVNKQSPAILYLCATLRGYRRKFEATVDENKYGTETVKRDDLVYQLETFNQPGEATYSASPNAEILASNIGDYIALLASRYDTDSTGEIEVCGIVSMTTLNLSGLIQQITWAVDQGGARTTYSLNREHNFSVPPRSERDFFSRMKRLLSQTSTSDYKGEI